MCLDTIDFAMRDLKLLLLALLGVGNEQQIRGITRFQKLVFLAQNEIDDLQTKGYHFDKHDYGPFSKDMYDDLDGLISTGYVEQETTTTQSGNDRYTYKLTEKGGEYIDDLLASDKIRSELKTAELEKLKTEYGGAPILELIKRVYQDYPRYTTESKLEI